MEVQIDQETIRVVIIDDDDGIRQGFEWMLRRSPQLEVIGAFRSCREAEPVIGETPPDVILMDIGLPDKSGIECVKSLKELYPNIQFLMLTVYSDEEKIFQSLKAGAVGYLLKKTEPAKLLEAILDAHRGGAPMSSEIARKVLHYFQEQKPRPDSAPLSDRERQVLEALVDGHSYKAIADRLFLSIHTVRFHLQNIYSKLHVNTRSEAIVKALKNKLV